MKILTISYHAWIKILNFQKLILIIIKQINKKIYRKNKILFYNLNFINKNNKLKMILH